MNGYSNSRGMLLPRVSARTLSLAIVSALTLAACGGGGGGSSSGSNGGGSNNPPPAANQAPTANAGADKTAAFPEPVQLTGTASDPENATLTYTWTQTAGPGSTTFSAASALTTNATFSAPGDYTLRLSVSDGTNTTTDDVAVSIPALYPSASAWTVATPAEVGLNATLLDQAKQQATSFPRDFPSTTTSDNGGSGMIIRYGKLAYQWGDTTVRYDLKSTTKSIGGIALLLGIDDGVVALDTNAASKVSSIGTPPANSDSWRNAITVEQLATHSAGFLKSDPSSTTDDGVLDDAPGTVWRYSDAGLNWLADVLTASLNTDLNTALTSRVLTPLNITSASFTWRANAARVTPLPGTSLERRELASGISANVDAMARIGYLFLRQGLWANNQRVISAPSVDLVHEPRSLIASLPIEPTPADFPKATVNYGVLWWTNKNTVSGDPLENVPRDAYWSWGLGESLIVVIPTLDLVIVRAGVPDQSNANRTGWNQGWNGDYAALKPFLEPIAQAANP